jgi:hypothetical protein
MVVFSLNPDSALLVVSSRASRFLFFQIPVYAVRVAMMVILYQ